MARPDPFLNSRLENLSDYKKDKIIYYGPGKKDFFRVYNSKVKSYVYIVAVKKHNKYYFSAFYYKGHWYRNEARTNTYLDGKVDPTLIKVYTVGKTTKKKLLYSLWEQNWVKLY